eukprot:scaffold62036_cov73-Phaeocystis_antarctica.AAC.1
MRITTLPKLPPLCSSRNAASHRCSRSNARTGSGCTVPCTSRRDSWPSTPCIHAESRAISVSRASASYEKAPPLAPARSLLHAPRLPISIRAPPSPSNAAETATKSLERLLSTSWSRQPQCALAAPHENAPASRELHSRPTRCSRSGLCFCGRPAVPLTSTRSQCAYATATSPTPPAAACSSTHCPACSRARPNARCTVLQTVGSVHTASNDRAAGFGASSRASVRALSPSGAYADPKTASAGRSRPAPPPVTAITPAQSLPGGPGSPGYWSSTLSTSRKLSPTACTRSSTSPAGSGPSNAGCCSSRRLLIAPRACRWSRAPPRSKRVEDRRGTRQLRPGASPASSGSACGSIWAIAPTESQSEPRSATQPSGREGASALATRARPCTPAPAMPGVAETSHTRGSADPTCALASRSVAASAGSGRSEACMSATTIDAMLAARAALPPCHTARCSAPTTAIAPPPGGCVPAEAPASRHTVSYRCSWCCWACARSIRVRKPSSCALPTPSPPPSATSAASAPDADATAQSTPAAGPRISTASTAYGSRVSAWPSPPRLSRAIDCNAPSRSAGCTCVPASEARRRSRSRAVASPPPSHAASSARNAGPYCSPATENAA